MAVDQNEVTRYLADQGIANTVAGTDVTLTGTLTYTQVRAVGDAVWPSGYALVIAAGVPKLSHRVP